MPLNTIINQFTTISAQCDGLITAAHRVDVAGNPLFSQWEKEQITVTAFLTFYKGWEEFLEASIAQFMVGNPATSGRYPVRYASPADASGALKMIIGTQRYFDFANHANVRKIVEIYFSNGHPYEPHLGGLHSELEDLRAMRNAAAHISSTTQRALESLAIRLLGAPHPGITLYALLTSTPMAGVGTVYSAYRDKLIVAAGLIAVG